MACSSPATTGSSSFVNTRQAPGRQALGLTLHRRHPALRRLAERPVLVASTSAGQTSITDNTAQTAPAGLKEPPVRPWTTHTWLWRGYKVKYLTAGCGKVPVLLIHGFGASSLHWRKNIGVLAEAGYKVYAVDLIGQGGSDKPAVSYSMELWRDQLQDFLDGFVEQPAVLVGNSLGSLAGLMVAESVPKKVAALVLLNCAGGMNNKAVMDDWRLKLVLPIIDSLLKSQPIAERLFNSFRTPNNIRSILLNVYCNKAAVDDELVDLIYQPSCDPGALDAFVSILTGPPGPRPESLLASLDPAVPLLCMWGDEDPMTPVDGPVGAAFRTLQRPNSMFKLLEGIMHCPMDDSPELVHAELLPWLEEVL